MNYLAHMRLAGDDPECLIGNFLGDFVKGRLSADIYTPGIRHGIVMHRSIDAWTDSHEITRQCARIVSPRRRRWSRVILDIFYDHLLAVNWERYSDESFAGFLNRAYVIILGASDIFPERDVYRIRTLVEGGWIERCRTISGLGMIFDGLSRRARRENPLSGSERELVEHYDELNNYFNRFFPEVIEYAKSIEKEDGAATV